MIFEKMYGGTLFAVVTGIVHLLRFLNLFEKNDLNVSLELGFSKVLMKIGVVFEQSIGDLNGKKRLN